MPFVVSNLDLLTVGIAVAMSSIFGFIVFFREPQSATNRLFLIFSLVNAGWSVSNYISYQTDIVSFRLLFIRLVLFFGILHAFSFFLFIYTFPRKIFTPSYKVKKFLIPAIAAIAILTLSPFVFSGIRQASVGEVSQPIHAPGIVLFVLSVAFLVICGMLILFSKFRHAGAEDKVQLRYLVWGSVLMFGLIIGFTLVLPIFFENTRFVPLSAIFTLPFFLLTGYAIVRYNLLHIKVVAAEILMLVVVIVSFLEIVLSTSISEMIFRVVIFCALLALGILLIRSVRKEVEQRERLQELTQELAETNRKLEEFDRQKSEFVSMAGHQLRAPLTVIKGYTSLMLEGTIKGTTPAAREVLEKVAFSTEQLVKLVAGLLDLSRIESGKIKYEMTEGDLVKVAGEVIDKFKQNAEKKGLGIMLENKAGAAVFVFDRDKIREAVVNLVDNAVKYSRQGSIVVALERADTGAGARMRLSVKDTGIGVKAEDIKNLFAKFSRTEEAKKTDPNGMGIGLFFVKRVVEDHGGSIGVSSEGIGHGSTFWFEVPMRSEGI